MRTYLGYMVFSSLRGGKGRRRGGLFLNIEYYVFALLDGIIYLLPSRIYSFIRWTNIAVSLPQGHPGLRNIRSHHQPTSRVRIKEETAHDTRRLGPGSGCVTPGLPS